VLIWGFVVLGFIKDNIRQYGLVVALVAIALFFQIVTGGVIFRPANITNLILQNSYILILAIGMVLVIISFGRVDLSVGSIAAVAGAISGVLIITNNLPVWLVIPAVLVIGAICGAWHGFWIAYRNIPFFVVTLAGMMLFRGIAMIVLDGTHLGPFPASFQMIAMGFIPDVFGGIYIQGTYGYNADGIYGYIEGYTLNTMAIVICALLAVAFVITELRKRVISRKNYVKAIPAPFFIVKLVFVVAVIALFAYWFGASNGIPNIMVLLGVLTVIYSFMANRTVMGRHLYAAGGIPKLRN